MMSRDFGHAVPSLPPSVQARIIEFMAANRHGRIELDVKAGVIVGFRIVESIRVGEDAAVVALRETG